MAFSQYFFRQTAAVALLLFPMGGCATEKWTPPPIEATVKPYALTPADTKMVKDVVLYQMKDASSTTFRNLGAVQKPDGSIGVCGEVNSKNSFGGYTGFTPFSGTISNGKFSIMTIASDPETRGIVIRNCSYLGKSI
jgi:hypothetical protein